MAMKHPRKTMLDQIDLDSIQDVEAARRAIVLLFNLIEELQTTVRSCRRRTSGCGMRSTG
jgi:hypothetical protein